MSNDKLYQFIYENRMNIQDDGTFFLSKNIYHHLAKANVKGNLKSRQVFRSITRKIKIDEMFKKENTSPKLSNQFNHGMWDAIRRGIEQMIAEKLESQLLDGVGLGKGDKKARSPSQNRARKINYSNDSHYQGDQV